MGQKKITDVATRFIPAGYIPEIRPNISTEAAKFVDERDVLRATNPDDPRIKTLSSNIKNMVRGHIRTKWRAYLEKCEFGANSLWHTIKSLTNRKTQDSNAPISFEGTIISDKKKVANQFNKQFTSHPTREQ